MLSLISGRSKKQMLLCLLIVAAISSMPSSSFAQSSYSWQGALIRNLNSENFWVYPSADLGSDGKTYLMYRYKSGDDVRIERWDGTSWTPITSFLKTALPNGLAMSDYQDLAVDGNNNIHIVTRGTTTNDTHGLFYGFYNGSSWSFEYIDSYPALYNSKYYVTRPIIEVDANNNPYIAYVVRDSNPTPSQRTMKCAMKKNGSWTITNVETIVEDKGDEFDMYDFTVSASGVPHVVYSDEYNNDYVFDIRHEYYNGTSWVPTTILSNRTSSGFLIKTDGSNNPYIIMGEGAADFSNYTLKLHKNISESWTNETIFGNGPLDYWPADISFNGNGDLNILYSTIDWNTWETSAVQALQKENGTWKSFTSTTPTDYTQFSESTFTFDDNKAIVIAYTNDLSERPRTISYIVGKYSSGVTLPTAPSTPDLASASDSGSSNTDNITNDNTPTFIGTSQPSKTIKLYANNTEVGSTIADGSGNWSVTSSTLASGTYAITAKASDGNGQSPASSSLSITIDTQSPTTTVSSTVGNPTNVSPFAVTITFNEAVTGFDISDIVVTNGSTSNFTGAGATYGVNITPVADGTVTVNVAGAVATDIAGNSNTASVQFNRESDQTKPAVTLSTTATNPTNASPIEVAINFSEAVSGFAINDLTIVGGTPSNFAGSGTSYSVDVTPASDGTVTINIAAGVAADAAGNGNTAASQFNIISDRTGPEVNLTSTASDPTNLNTINVAVTFSENVTGFDIDDVSVTGASKSNLVGSGKDYSIDLTPTADGTVTVNIGASIAVDAVGNFNTASKQFSIVSDRTKPSVTLSSAVTETTNLSPFTVSVTFNETVTGFDINDITVSNGSTSNFTGSGASYSVHVTPTADGKVTVDVGAAATADMAGNSNESSNQFSVMSDRTRPTVTLTSGTHNPANAVIDVTFIFSETVTNFVKENITIDNGTVSDFQHISGTEYKASVNPLVDGTVTIEVLTDVVLDNAGNGNNASEKLTRKYDATKPSVTVSSTSAEHVNNSFMTTFTFDEDVAGFDANDIVIINGSVSGFAATSASIYSALITPTAEGDTEVSVAASAAADMAGNSCKASNVLVRHYDATQPSVTVSSAESELVNAPFTVTFTFNEGVTGFGPADVIIVNGTGSSFQAASESIYTMAITPESDGSVEVSVAANVATDAATNGNTASNVLKRSYDGAAPTVLISSEKVLVKAEFSVTVTFSEEVSGFDIGHITVSNGSAANLQTTDNTQYTAIITPDSDGDVTVSVSSGAAEDAAGNSSTSSNNLEVSFDGTKPNGYSISSPVSLVDISNVMTFSFSVADAEMGAAYFYTISSNNGGAVVSGNGTVVNKSFSFSDIDLSSVYDGTITVAFHLVDEAGNQGVDATLQVSKLTRNIVDVTSPATINVPIRTTFSALNLPTTVEVTYSNGEREYISVTWQEGSYDGMVAAEYVLTGIVTLPPNTTNNDELTAAVIVQVNSNLVPTGITLSSSSFKPDISSMDPIGVFATQDVDDTEHMYELVSGQGDDHNAYFIISGDELFLNTGNTISGISQFLIRVRSTDAYDNSVEQTFTLTKQAYAPPNVDIKVPNSFSPNGDGVNDEWRVPELAYYNDVVIEVFDRAGNRLFITTDPQVGWDGRGIDNKVLLGPYFYVIQIRDTGETKKGVLMLLRK